MLDDPLRDLIMKSSPQRFWQEIASRQEALYNEAYSYSFNEGLWEKPEAETVLPVVRRALFENVVRQAARVARVESLDMMHKGDNYPYVLVKCAKLVMTAHHVPGPCHFVRPAESRKQNAAVNEWLDTWVRQELLIRPLPDLRRSGNVNVLILHGQTREKMEGKEISSSFLQLAIPDADLNEYRRIYHVKDLLQSYSQQAVADKVDVRVADRARPAIRRRSK